MGLLDRTAYKFSDLLGPSTVVLLVLHEVLL